MIDAKQAFAGFSNAAPITVAALYVLARAVEDTGALRPLIDAALGRAEGQRAGILRLGAAGRRGLRLPEQHADRRDADAARLGVGGGAQRLALALS